MVLVVAVVLGLSFLSSCSAAAVTTQTTTVVVAVAILAQTTAAVANQNPYNPKRRFHGTVFFYT